MITIRNEIMQAESFLAAHETELEALLLETAMNLQGKCDGSQRNPVLNQLVSAQQCEESRKKRPFSSNDVGVISPPNKKKGRNKRCEAPDCHKGSSFNYEGVIGYRFCSTHKLDGMVNIRTKKKGCESVGCLKEPSYNFKTAPRGRFCIDHKLGDMVIICPEVSSVPREEEVVVVHVEGRTTRPQECYLSYGDVNVKPHTLSQQLGMFYSRENTHMGFSHHGDIMRDTWMVHDNDMIMSSSIKQQS